MELSATIVALGPPAQPWTVPSSVTKMNLAWLPLGRWKSAGLPLNIIPVGDPGIPFWLGALGIVTIPLPLIGTMATGGTDGGDRVNPEASYRVDVPPALLETHHGEVGLATSPQGFWRFASGTGVWF